MLITDSESTVSSDGTKPGKEDPSPSCREGGGIGQLSAEPPRLYAPPYRWDGWGTADLAAECSPPTQSSRGSSHSAYQVWMDDHHQVAHMPSMGKLKRVAKVQTLMVEPP